MAIIGKPTEVWELPAPLDTPAPADAPFDADADPITEETEVAIPVDKPSIKLRQTRKYNYINFIVPCRFRKSTEADPK